METGIMKLKSIEEEAADCRAAWAANPEVKVAHCLHHEIHLEPLTDPIENRIAYILTEKPEEEQALRLRCLRPWTGRLSAEWEKARAEWGKAVAEWDKAWAELGKAWAAWDKAWAEWEKAWAELDKARAEWGKARAELEKTRAELDKAWAE